MPVSSGDLNSSFLFYRQPLYISIGIFCLLTLLLLGWLKVTYGSFSIGNAKKKWKENIEMRKRYDDLFATRNNLMYHISWAKSRGEKEQARSMMQQLDKVDKVSEYYYIHLSFTFNLFLCE